MNFPVWPCSYSFVEKNSNTNNSSDYLSADDINKAAKNLAEKVQFIGNMHSVHPDLNDLMNSLFNKLLKSFKSIDTFKSTEEKELYNLLTGSPSITQLAKGSYVVQQKGDFLEPVYIQPSLFEGTKWDPNEQDEPF